MDALRQNKWFMFTLEQIKSLIVICNYCKMHAEKMDEVSCIQNRWNIAIWLVFIRHSHRLVICCVKCVCACFFFSSIFFCAIISFYLAYLIKCTFSLGEKRVAIISDKSVTIAFFKVHTHSGMRIYQSVTLAVLFVDAKRSLPSNGWLHR